METIWGMTQSFYDKLIFAILWKEERLIQTKKQDLLKTRICSNIFRFIDDICTFNNYEFRNDNNNIYADELELKNENEDPCKS